MSANDTIAAIATPPGRGGVGIVRVSGTAVEPIARQVLEKMPAPRLVQYGAFIGDSGSPIDVGLAIRFVAPCSFTGEDVLELQGHGGPVVLDILLQRVVALGARLAKPGEFAERAFLNDKLDLTQAEAIADLIEAGSEQAARSAMRSLQGVFSDRIHVLVESLVTLRMYLEGSLDFPEEEIDFLSDGKIMRQTEAILKDIAAILQEARQGVLLRDGMRVVLAGQPNTGKSSLLNMLAGKASAIVTDTPGTTRDILREEIHIDGMPLHIIDTAGLRESADQVEQIGVQRAWEQIEQADRVLLLVDAKPGLRDSDRAILDKFPEPIPVTVIHNKIDRYELNSKLSEKTAQIHIWLSAKTGEGLDVLREHLKHSMGFHQTSEGMFMARRRHLEALVQAQTFIEHGKQQLSESAAGELLAEDLRQAQQVLNEITGEFTSDDLLGKIFSSFCVGK